MTLDLLDLEAGAGPSDGAAAEPRAVAGLLPASLGAPAKITRGMMRRRGMAIRSYVGPNGSGKTAAAVRDLLPSIYAGRPILSTVPIYDHRTGELYEHYIRFSEWDLLLDDGFRHADILMDEVTGIANSRDSMGMPRQVQAVLDKLRKRDLTLSWTAPAWGRADTTIRSTSIGVTLCRGYLSAPMPKDSTADVPAWRPRRLFRVRTFSAVDFEDFSLNKATGNAQGKALRAEVVEWWWGPGSAVFSSYDSMDPVSRVGEVLDSGRCAHCGGRRPVPQCKCDH